MILKRHLTQEPLKQEFRFWSKRKNLKKVYKFLKENNSIVLFFSCAILQKKDIGKAKASTI